MLQTGLRVRTIKPGDYLRLTQGHGYLELGKVALSGGEIERWHDSKIEFVITDRCHQSFRTDVRRNTPAETLLKRQVLLHEVTSTATGDGCAFLTQEIFECADVVCPIPLADDDLMDDRV